MLIPGPFVVGPKYFLDQSKSLWAVPNFFVHGSKGKIMNFKKNWFSSKTFGPVLNPFRPTEGPGISLSGTIFI